MPRARLIATAALAALATPASASAQPTVTTDLPCYVAEEQAMQFTGQGFTPGAAINLLFGANGNFGSFQTTADAAGAFQAAVRAPSFDAFDEKPPSFGLFVSANDQSKFGPDGPIGPPEESAAFLDLRITEWKTEVAAFKRKVKRGQRVKLETIGWTGAGDTLYIHYLRGGKAVHSAKVGKLKGDCGDLTAHFKAFAFKSAKPGAYSVRFSTDSKWDARGRWAGLNTVRLAA